MGVLDGGPFPVLIGLSHETGICSSSRSLVLSAMSPSVTVMSFNLRRDRPSDGPNSWEQRRDACVAVVAKYAPAVLCTQEGMKAQLEDLAQALSGYEQFGMSRKGSEDPSEEHCAILYDREKVEQMDGGTFWLSESPSVQASTSWGMSTPCIATWVTLQLRGVQPPGFAFQVVNTHLDCSSKRAQRRSVLLLWQHIASLPPTLPVILCGGFEARKDAAPGRFLLGRSREHGMLGDMRDAWASTGNRGNSSLIYTYHGFKGNKHGAMESLKMLLRAFCLCWDRHNQDLHVDWILFRGRTLAPAFCEVVSDSIDARYPSDHYPVYVEFLLPRSVRSADEYMT